jgi:hypothetical protein
MKVIDPGREYELSASNRLCFLQKERGEIVRDGTTNEEVLEVLIDRVTDAYQRLPCQESIRAVHFLREALTALRNRTASRVRLNVEGTLQPHYSHSTPSRDPSDGMAIDISGLDLAPN